MGDDPRSIFPERYTTPAEAGAQLGDGDNIAVRVITITFQLGPGLRRGGSVVRANASLFSREGGSPVWIPAFAGKHAAFTS